MIKEIYDRITILLKGSNIVQKTVIKEKASYFYSGNYFILVLDTKDGSTLHYSYELNSITEIKIEKNVKEEN